MADAEWGDLPFDAAIAFFRDKLSMPTATWLDLWQEMHARAFVVAGAMEAGLIEDLRAAVDDGIANGTTIATFRERFAEIVDRYGWTYQGGLKWRTSVIYNTNLRVAHARGRYRQMTDPDVMRVRPYLRYVRSSATNPRAEHLAWANTVLPHDDPWWNTHYPPNGWGCKCSVVSVSRRELAQLIDEKKGGPNPIRQTAPEIEYEDWQNPKTGEVLQVPVGIDPGWAYHPGRDEWRG